LRLHDRIKMILGEVGEALARVDEQAVARLVEAILGARRVFIFGQGRTGYVTRAFAVRLMHLGLDVHFVGDTTTPPIKNTDICLVNSGTGETRFAYHVVMAARAAGARTATITAHPEARIGSLVDIVVHVPAPTRGEQPAPEGWRQPLGSVFEQATLILLDAIVLILMQRLGRTPQSLLERHTNIE